jgi:hypothetical protein
VTIPGVACPVDGCLVFPFDTDDECAAHVAAGVHVTRGSWRLREPARWVRTPGGWFVLAPGARVHDVVPVEKSSGAVVRARLTGRHDGDLFTAKPVDE